MLEVEEDDLHEHEDEDAPDQERGRHSEMERENAEQDRGQHRRAEDLPAEVAGLQAFQDRQAHGTPAHDPACAGADHGPPDGQQDEVHGAKVWRMAATGAGFPVHISNAAAPCARSTPHPSAVRSPSDRALRTSGVPPVT